MASQIEIANWALIKLGVRRLEALSDDDEKAEIISDIWSISRDSALRAANWRFAMTRTTLAADVAAPSWGFTRQYTLPGDCVRIVQVSDIFPGPDLSLYTNSESAPYLIEGDKILTDLAGSATSALKIRYVRNSVDIGLWDACFAEAFACRLAMDLSERLTEANSKFDKMAGLYSMALRDARRANAIEHPPRRIGDSSWLAVRQTAG